MLCSLVPIYVDLCLGKAGDEFSRQRRTLQQTGKQREECLTPAQAKERVIFKKPRYTAVGGKIAILQDFLYMWIISKMLKLA